jgi:hypothetical protein
MKEKDTPREGPRQRLFGEEEREKVRASIPLTTRKVGNDENVGKESPRGRSRLKK